MDDMISRQAAQPEVCGTNVGDNISRQEAIDELVRWGKLPDYNDGERNIIACTIGMLSALPSAQPEYEKISADDVAVSIAATKIASAIWLYETLTELEKAGYVICRKMT